MRIVVINQKVAFVRHWFRWYKVQRGGEDWRTLPIGKQYVKEKSIAQISKQLSKKYGNASLLNEKAADAEVAKNLKKAGNSAHKKRAV